jgi:hypothetical protein
MGHAQPEPSTKKSDRCSDHTDDQDEQDSPADDAGSGFPRGSFNGHAGLLNAWIDEEFRLQGATTSSQATRLGPSNERDLLIVG